MLVIYLPPLRSLVALLTAVALAACTTAGDTTDHGGHHPDQTSAGTAPLGSGMMAGQSGAGMMGGAATGTMGSRGMDMNQMCATYRSMQNAPAGQRQAMMDQQMNGMSAEMRQQHMEMMRQQC